MAYLKLSEKSRVFVDTETSGLDPILNEILEIAIIKSTPMATHDEIMVVKIKPRRIHTAHPKALEVNGYNEAEWADAVDITVAAPAIMDFLRDSVFVAHNAKFDVGFVEAFLKEAGIKERIDYHTICTCSLAYAILVPRGLESLSLTPVCNFLGIPAEPTMHRALAGATACKAIYDKMTGMI